MNHHSRPLLILDLDETLIRGSETLLDRDQDFRVGPFFIYNRPHLHEFLRVVNPHYELAIWSSATMDYVNGIAAELATHVDGWQFVWARDRCVRRFNPETFEIEFFKDLRKVKRRGFDLRRVLVVEDTPQKVSRHYGNAVYVRPYEGDDQADDDELSKLVAYLRGLSGEPDFRRIEKRGWRMRGCDLP